MSKLPPLKFSKFDKLWVTEVYRIINENKRPSYRNIRAKLYKQLPQEFDPDEIDIRLARYRGEEITLQGVDLVSPEADVINKSNKIILSIKQLLIENPSKEVVVLSEISSTTKISLNEVSLLLRLISPYGRFWSTASGNQHFQYGYSDINIQNDNAIFDQYLYFTDIQDLMNRYFIEQFNESKSNERRISGLAPNPKSTDVKLNPIFKSKIDRIDTRLCFVLMPFKKPWSDEIFDLIRSTIESLNLQCLRADNLKGPIIIEDIWTKINQAGFIIADVTDKNPNVMYEVGIAHTVGRPTILLTQNADKIPFDFAHLRHIGYRNSASGAEKLRNELREAIKGIYDEKEINK